jgi:hypothetical protein
MKGCDRVCVIWIVTCHTHNMDIIWKHFSCCWLLRFFLTLTRDVTECVTWTVTCHTQYIHHLETFFSHCQRQVTWTVMHSMGIIWKQFYEGMWQRVCDMNCHMSHTQHVHHLEAFFSLLTAQVLSYTNKGCDRVCDINCDMPHTI